MEQHEGSRVSDCTSKTFLFTVAFGARLIRDQSPVQAVHGLHVVCSCPGGRIRLLGSEEWVRRDRRREGRGEYLAASRGIAPMTHSSCLPKSCPEKSLSLPRPAFRRAATVPLLM